MKHLKPAAARLSVLFFLGAGLCFFPKNPVPRGFGFLKSGIFQTTGFQKNGTGVARKLAVANISNKDSFSDGLQRPVQVKKTGVIWDGAGKEEVKMIVSGRGRFDAFGRAVENFYPTLENLGANNEIFNPGFDNIAPTKTSFDVLDRAISAVLPDGSFSKNEHGFGSDNLGVLGFQATATDFLGNKKTSFSDVRGRNRATKTEDPAGDIWVNSKYNALAELLETVDNDGNRTKYGYDFLGRNLSIEQADAGETVFKYDLAGNKIFASTAEIRASIGDTAGSRYTFDHQRLVQVDFPKNFQDQVKFHYGEPGAKSNRAGRIWLTEDASGG